MIWVRGILLIEVWMQTWRIFIHRSLDAVLQSAALQIRLSPPAPLEFWNSRATYPTLFNSTSTQSSVCTSRSREAFGCAVD
ncbi:hypothetical protein P3P1_93 [Pseudomonas aeruginosa]|nr:hypothetical protein P3P1_93 [Pseudomonas aeruginosa]